MAMHDLQMYRQAIAEVSPALAGAGITVLGQGKDFTVCRTAGGIVFRFPKRPDAERKLRMEIALLPVLAPTLPLPIGASPRNSITIAIVFAVY